MITGRPTKLTDEIVQKALDYVFVNKEDEGAGWTADGSVIPTIEGLAIYLQINRDTLYDWAEKNNDFSDILDEVKKQQASMLINLGLSGKYNSTITKLMLSKHGYTEKTEVDQNIKAEITGEYDPITAKKFSEFMKDDTKG